MTRDEAATLVAELVAAFPAQRMPKATASLYVGVFEREFADPELAREIVRALILNPATTRLPAVGVIVGAYRRREERWRLDNWRGRELPEALPGREENLEHVRDLMRRFWPDRVDDHNGGDEKEVA
jgi:hypothetical protein